MIQSDQEQNQQKLVLPPLPKNTGGQSACQLLTLIAYNKYKYQQELQRQEPTNRQYHLKYARYDTLPSGLDDRRNQENAEEEYLARGSIVNIKHGKGEEYGKKGTLKTNSTIQHLNQVSFLNDEAINLPIQISKNRYRSIEPKSKGSYKRNYEGVSSQRQKNHFQGRENGIIYRDVLTKKKQRIKTDSIRERDRETEQSDSNPQVSYSQKGNVRVFKECMSDLKRGTKTNQRLQRAAKALQTFNPFFRKIQRVIGVCLLRVGRIRQKQANSILYLGGEVYTHFSIILLGEVKIMGKNGMHKICETGETLLEEVLFFEEGKSSKAIPNNVEKARAMEQSWILEVEREDLHKVQRQLNRFGFKEGLREMRTLIKRNSIVKNWVRNKFSLLQKQ